MTTLLGIDLETTGLDPEKDEIIEVGLVLWDAENKTPLAMHSELVYPQAFIPKEITELTGISEFSFQKQEHMENDILSLINKWAKNADYMVAHNAGFEKSFLPGFSDRKWIDTRIDLPFKSGKGNGTLSDICMGHGVFNVMPHRALPDVISMMQLLAQYDFSEIKKSADADEMDLVIRFPYDATGKRNGVVKSLGYRWDGDNKAWVKSIKDIGLEAEKEKALAAGFRVDTAAPVF